MSNAEKLFSPFELGSLVTRNRVVMAPMTRNLSPGHVPNDQVVEYYRRRAAGGVGLIITEGTCVGHKAANGYARVPFIYGEEALAGWRKVVEAVHAEGGSIAAQLWHIGAVRTPGSGPDPEVPGYGPSGMAEPGIVTGHVMSKRDIDEVVSAFHRAARDAREVGFDAVEIHGAHGYLIDQFFWDATNVREDEYGGSLANRSRFAVEVVAAARKAVGSDFPIIFRWSQWKEQDNRARLVETPEALAEFLKPLCDAGVDIFHCSTRRYWAAEFENSQLNLAGWTKKLTGKPAITVGSVGLDIDRAASDRMNLERCLDNNEFDLVAVGRALIANPEWANLMCAGNFRDLSTFDDGQLETLV